MTIPTPFPVGPINCYLAEGDALTLIDTGPNDPATLVALRDQLRARGAAFKDIRRIVVTHAHVDHFGLAAQIVAESGAQVLAHTRNRWWLTDFNYEWNRRHDFYSTVLARSGAPRAFAEQAVLEMRWLEQFGGTVPAECFSALADGALLRLGGDEWRVVFAPGHASGLICLHQPDARVLISSDHILRDITSNPILEPPARAEAERPRALMDYVASMAKIARLDPQIALPAHGAPVPEVHALVEARLAFHRARLEQIAAQLADGVNTVYELCGVLFPKLQPVDTFLGLSEVIGHLDILESAGRVRREEREGVDRYIPTKDPKGF